MHKSMNKTWIWIVVLLGIFIGLSFILESNQPKEHPPFTTQSPSPTGIKAFYTFLQEELVSVKRLGDTPHQLHQEENQLLLMVEPNLLDNQEVMDEYIAFMEAGNTVLLFKHNVEGMFQLHTEFAVALGEVVPVTDRHNREWEATIRSDMRIIPNQEDEVLLQDEQGVLAIKREYGDGQLIAVNSPDWLTNEFILEADHLSLILHLIDEEPKVVWFDEYSHRSSPLDSFTEIYPMWLLVLGIQLIFLTGLWLLYKGKRFGPIRMPREAYVRFSDEHITSLATWYQKGKLYQASLQIQADYVKMLLREKWGIPYQQEWKSLHDQLSFKVKEMSEEEISVLIQEIEGVLNKTNISKQEYVLWAKRIDRLRNEVEQ